jgi:hypothetical protein
MAIESDIELLIKRKGVSQTFSSSKCRPSNGIKTLKIIVQTFTSDFF